MDRKAAKRMEPFSPVSYTHLDVYKRQVIVHDGDSAGAVILCAYDEKADKSEIAEKLAGAAAEFLVLYHRYQEMCIRDSFYSVLLLECHYQLEKI